MADSERPAAVGELPTPQQCPGADVVIYDGQCGLCRGTTRMLKHLDGRCRLAFLPLDDPQTGMRYPDLSHEELLKHVYVVEPGGQQHRGAEAVRYVSRRLPALWLLALLMYLPGTMPLWRWLYDAVSKRRYRLSGERSHREGSID
jgi:predicted DCC family thiol-disulfide oxidoreductase YuxK